MRVRRVRRIRKPREDHPTAPFPFARGQEEITFIFPRDHAKSALRVASYSKCQSKELDGGIILGSHTARLVCLCTDYYQSNRHPPIHVNSAEHPHPGWLSNSFAPL